MRHVLYIWSTALTIGFCALLWLQLRGPRGDAPTMLPATARFETIDVHRINVIEPDGKPRVILASSKHGPGAIWGGVEYPHPGRATGGILFYNDEGTEAGGITYSSDPSDRSAGAIFTMDQREQDQTLVLQYEEVAGKRGAGLIVYDRPEKSLLPVLQAYRDYTRAPAEDKPRLEAQLEQVAAELASAAPRLFVGKQQDDAMLVLSDKQGRPRLALKVDGAGTPSLELFDADGKVTARLPEG
jgi:hypothetical protein